MTQQTGCFIVVEGIDGSGKSTLVNALGDLLVDEYFPQRAVRTCCFPARDNALAPIIEDHLSGKRRLPADAMHAIFAADRLLSKQRLVRWLADGEIVVCDRYTYSGAAYSVAQGVPLNFALQCDQLMPKPDIIIRLCLPVDVACERIAARNAAPVAYEKKEFLSQVRDAYTKVLGFASPVVELGADMNAAELAQIALEIVKAVLK
jgi:dTMP kinase